MREVLFSGFARNYGQLFISRAILGIGEASYYPAGTSLLSDYFPKNQRGRVMSIWGAGSTIGIAVSFAGGGYIADKFGWRDVFFFAAVPGILCALLAPGDATWKRAARCKSWIAPAKSVRYSHALISRPWPTV